MSVMIDLRHFYSCMILLYEFNRFLVDQLFFWLRWVFVAARGLFSSCGERGYSLLQCAGFLLRWLLVVEHGL